MEQAQYLMVMNKKRILNSHFQGSWEEQAFAEDAAGVLGGCVWPPRSYSCSFCRREFKSAQALGGHMNIHRRDRAKLKQSLSLHNKTDLHHQKSGFVSSPLSPSMESFSILPSTVSDSKAELQKNQTKEECTFRSHEGSTMETDLSVSLNSVTRRNRSAGSDDDDDDDEATAGFKRPKTVVFSLLEPCSQQSRSQPEVLGSMEEIDLELRLGDLPKVK